MPLLPTVAPQPHESWLPLTRPFGGQADLSETSLAALAMPGARLNRQQCFGDTRVAIVVCHEALPAVDEALHHWCAVTGIRPAHCQVILSVTEAAAASAVVSRSSTSPLPSYLRAFSVPWLTADTSIVSPQPRPRLSLCLFPRSAPTPASRHSLSAPRPPASIMFVPASAARTSLSAVAKIITCTTARGTTSALTHRHLQHCCSHSPFSQHLACLPASSNCPDATASMVVGELVSPPLPHVLRVP